jgi:hypothetical protein
MRQPEARARAIYLSLAGTKMISSLDSMFVVSCGAVGKNLEE